MTEKEKTPQEVILNTYDQLEKVITELNLTAAKAEKTNPHEAEFLQELAEDVFGVLKKVAGKMSGCGGCTGCCGGCDSGCE